MNLTALSPSLLDKFQKYARTYATPRPGFPPSTKLKKLVVLGEGTPDDLIAILIAHQINGSETVAIVKPLNHRGTSTLQLIDFYFNPGRLNVILFVIDQEALTLTGIAREISKQLRKYRGDFKCSQNEFGRRLLVFTCPSGAGSLSVIVTINGHPDINTKNHMIEDHCIVAAGRVQMIDLPSQVEHPKDYWQAKIQPQNRDQIFSSLFHQTGFLKEVFPQQYRACEILKGL
jgi:hypothetical protein